MTIGRFAKFLVRAAKPQYHQRHCLAALMRLFLHESPVQLVPPPHPQHSGWAAPLASYVPSYPSLTKKTTDNQAIDMCCYRTDRLIVEGTHNFAVAWAVTITLDKCVYKCQ